MDLKALMQKLETINTTQIVNESVETKQVITESVAAPVRKSAEPVFKGSIARSLAEEFGYELDEAPVTSGSGAPVTSGSGAPVQSGTPAPAAAAPAAAGGVPNPYQGADAAKFAAMSPEDQAWLTKGGGKPDINDQYILMRAPNKGKAVATAPAAAGGAATKPSATPAVAPGGVQAMGDDDGNTMITKPDGTVQVVGPDGKPLANGGKVDPTQPANPMAGGKPPAGGAGGDAAVKATREKLTALLDKLEKTGGVSGSAPAPAAPTAPAAPAKPTTGAATKPAAPVSGAQSAGQSVGGAIKSGAQAVGDFAKGAYQGLTKESVSFEDDKTLLAIKNIRY